MTDHSSLVSSLSFQYGYSSYIIDRWLRLWGLDLTHQLLLRNEKPLTPTIRVNTLLTTVDSCSEVLTSQGFVLTQDDPLLPLFTITKQPFSLSSTAEYLSGWFYLQGKASLYPVVALSPQPGELILDCCAAPGGKSTYIAQMMSNQGSLVCLDNNVRRIPSLKANLSRCGVTNSLIYSSDFRRFKPTLKFDRILIDAPCTGEGVIITDPSRKKNKSFDDILFCSSRQTMLFDHALSLLKDNGVIVYSTCSLAPEENELIVTRALQQHSDLNLVPAGLDKWTDPGLEEAFDFQYPSAITLTRRTFPPKHNTEGFFIAKFVKEAN
ncbi:MAG: NOL1/NOP2/sun family putative RNA methylase [Candidatus Kariarchaeaceae archaeon]